MKIDIRHIREPIHCTAASAVDTKMHFGLSFDGVHALFELGADTEDKWWEHVQVPSQSDGAQPLTHKCKAISSDRAVLMDSTQKTLLVNALLAAPGVLQSCLTTVVPADVRHIVLHVPSSIVVADTRNAKLNATTVSRFALNASKFGRISFEIRGAFHAEVAEQLDPALLTHVALTGTTQLQKSLQVLAQWMNDNASKSRLCCLKIDTASIHDPETRTEHMRSSVCATALQTLAAKIVCKPGALRFSLTLRHFYSKQREAQQTIGELMKDLVAATSADGPALILEECRVRLADALAIEETAAKTSTAVFIYKNDSKTTARTSDVPAAHCRFKHQSRTSAKDCADDELYCTHHDITADEHAWAAVRNLGFRNTSQPPDANSS